jgi:hypothetical protein
MEDLGTVLLASGSAIVVAMIILAVIEAYD